MSSAVPVNLRTPWSRVAKSDANTMWRDFQPRVTPASAADQTLIHSFLVSIFQQPSLSEFHAQTEDSLYEWTDRLLVKRGSQIISHVRLTKHEMQFENLHLPFAGVHDLATLPEYRQRGCANELLRAADTQMTTEGADFGLLRTHRPEWFAKRGWVVCGRHSYSEAGARDILSKLNDHQARRPDAWAMEEVTQPSLSIRLWRHFEEAALYRLYEENTVGTYGPLVRNEAYWRWLISRHGYDSIYVAIDGPDKLELDEELKPIVGYAVVKDGRILELMTSAEYPQAAAQLMERACGDAIERDHHPVRLDAPRDHPLHQMLVKAGGHFHGGLASHNMVWMVKLLEPLKLLRRLAPLFHRRAKQAKMSLPLELGIQCDDEKFRIVLSRRTARIERGKLGRSYLCMQRKQLAQLLLGHLNVAEAMDPERLTASTRVAAETAQRLFPSTSQWFPPLDGVPT